MSSQASPWPVQNDPLIETFSLAAGFDVPPIITALVNDVAVVPTITLRGDGSYKAEVTGLNPGDFVELYANPGVGAVNTFTTACSKFTVVEDAADEADITTITTAQAQAQACLNEIKASVGGVPAGGGVGAGTKSVSITYADCDGPIAGAQIWVNDSTGNTLIAGPVITNALGTATFLLDPSTSYLYSVAVSGNIRVVDQPFTTGV